MSDLVMPRLSDSMEEGTILRWLKADGDTIARGEEIVEIETDKATMTYESDLEGVLHILAEEGAALAVGELIATVGEPGATQSDAPAARPAQSPGAQIQAPRGVDRGRCPISQGARRRSGPRHRPWRDGSRARTELSFRGSRAAGPAGGS